MSGSETADGSGVPLSTIGQVVGIFALAGVGIGATGGVAMTQLSSGSAIFSGLLVLVILTVAFLLGPIIGLISGLRTGDGMGRTSESYLAGVLGSVAGYFVMILVVVLALSIAVAAVAGGGAGGGSSAATDAAGQTTTNGGSSGGLPIGEYIIPIIAVALPTGLTGLGGVYLGGGGAAPSGGGINLPLRYVAAGIVVVGVIAAGVVVGPELLTAEPQLEVDGGMDATSNTISTDATVTNPTDSEITNTMRVELVIDGEVAATHEEEITVRANSERQVLWRIATASDLTQSQVQAINAGDMELRYIINDETVDTYSPSSS